MIPVGLSGNDEGNIVLRLCLLQETADLRTREIQLLSNIFLRHVIQIVHLCNFQNLHIVVVHNGVPLLVLIRNVLFSLL